MLEVLDQGRRKFRKEQEQQLRERSHAEGKLTVDEEELADLRYLSGSEIREYCGDEPCDLPRDSESRGGALWVNSPQSESQLSAIPYGQGDSSRQSLEDAESNGNTKRSENPVYVMDGQDHVELVVL